MKRATNHLQEVALPAYAEPRRPAPKFADLSMAEQESCAKKLVEAIKQISNPHRLMLLHELNSQKLSVSELQAALDRRQPSVSNDLVLLRNLKLVESERSGNLIVNHLAKDKVHTIKALLDTLLKAY